MTHPHRLSLAVRRALAAATLAAGSAGLVACGGGDGSGPDSGSGSFSLGVTDAPVDDAEHVFIEFSSVTLVPDDENDSGDNGSEDGDGSGLVTIELDGAQRIDLLDLQNGKRALLIEDEQIPAGEYEQIRLNVDSTTIVLESAPGFEQDLFCPSCDQTGLKLNAEDGVVLSEGGTLDLTVDFDLRKSVIEAGKTGKYILKPTLRLVKTDETGEIAASATTNYIQNEAGCATDSSGELVTAVYVFEGADVTPDDIDGQDAEPVTTAALTNEDADATYTGIAGFLEAGTYTVAFTCNPEDDNPPSDGSVNDDDLTFLDVRNVEVVAGATAEYDLPL